MATEAHPSIVRSDAAPANAAPANAGAAFDASPRQAPDETSPEGGGVGSGAHRSYTTLVVVIFASYMAVAIGLYAWRGAYFTPDRWAIFLFLGAVMLGQWKAFLRDWVPVVMLIFGYEFMRGIAGQMVNDQMQAEGREIVHVQELIDADRALFGGTLPTHWLQDKLYVEGQVHWYDYVALLFTRCTSSSRWSSPSSSGCGARRSSGSSR